MTPRTPNPFAVWQAGLAFWTMMAEAQMVMALRLAAMGGFLPARPGEDSRMVLEKGPAFARSAMAAGAAIARGAAPEAVLEAAVKPLGRRTRANVNRLLTPAAAPAKPATRRRRKDA